MHADVDGVNTRPAPWILVSVLVYAAIVLIAPLVALLVAFFGADPSRSLQALFEDEARGAIVNSLLLAVIAVVANGVFGVAAGIVIARHRFFGRAVVDALSELPLSISPVMTGLGFILVYGRGGLLAPLLDAVGCKVTFAFPGLVLGTLFVTVPFTVREVASVLVELGTSEEQAAETLGASPWQTFWLVTLPNLRSALDCGAMLTMARALGEFGAVLVLGGAIGGHTQTATTYLYSAVEERDRAAAYGMALVLMATSLALFAALSRRRTRKT